MSQEPLRRAYDGITFFGCRKTIPNEIGHQQKQKGLNADAGSGAPIDIDNIDSDSQDEGVIQKPGTNAQGDDRQLTTESSADVALNGLPSNRVVNDFIIPACKPEDK